MEDLWLPSHLPSPLGLTTGQLTRHSDLGVRREKAQASTEGCLYYDPIRKSDRDGDVLDAMDWTTGSMVVIVVAEKGE